MKNARMSIVALLLLGYLQAQAQTTWVVDPAHSNVNFTVDHLVISEVDGSFKKFSGSLTETNGDLTSAEIVFDIVTASISTDNEKRDGHLKAEDFFYAEKYPKISFKSSSFQKINAKEYSLKGDLTMRGVTKQVTLTARYGGQVVDGYGNMRSVFKISGALKRMNYGIAWNGKTEHGSLVVGEDVDIEIKLELIKQK